MIVCEKVLGKITDPEFAGCEVDYLEIEWHDAYKRIHQKKTKGGIEVGVRLDTDILVKGLREGDVLYREGSKVIVVEVPACELIVIDVDQNHESMIPKVCYEIGNKHAALLRGENKFQFITPYNEPTLLLLNKLHGVSARKETGKMDFDKSISSTVSSHTH